MGSFGDVTPKLVLGSAGQLRTNQPVRIYVGEPLARTEPHTFFFLLAKKIAGFK